MHIAHYHAMRIYTLNKLESFYKQKTLHQKQKGRISYPFFFLELPYKIILLIKVPLSDNFLITYHHKAVQLIY
ncbi:hypothetical protein EFN47_09455 [Pediococcus acidilactici]|nr:hypothetical protein [Pediococcus acidilactici]